MSQYPQYPPPYSPTPPGYGGYAPQSPDQLLAPARRAGVLMIVLGVLFVFCGLCLAASSWMMGQPQFASSPEFAEARKQFDLVEQQTGVRVEQMLIIVGAVPLVLGALYGALGFVVRGGGFASAVLGIVLSAMLLLFFGLGMLTTAVQAAANPAAIGGVCVYAVPFLLLVLLMVWLVQAARAASQIVAARQQYQAQVWQYQQHQQNYLQNPGQQQQQGYGAPPAGMGYHYPPNQPPAGQPPVQQPAQQAAQQPPQPGPQSSLPPAPPGGYYVVPPPPADRKDPPDGTPPAG